MKSKEIVIYHSPDADDAFMFYGLTSGEVNVPGYSFSHELCDIESLNKRALNAELDVTAVSVHALPYLKNQYAVLCCGASMGGKDYGPRLVSREAFSLNDGTIRTFATPGEYTSATLALRLYLKENNIEAELLNLNFDEVQDAVKDGKVDAGVIIHEGQITHQKEGLKTVLDLGQWWWQEHSLPLPLGVNIVKKSLGEEAMKAAYSALKQSISYSLDHREQSLDYALTYGRGITKEEADRFVAMYVNELTLDMAEDGQKSIALFLEKAKEYKFIPSDFSLEFVGC